MSDNLLLTQRQAILAGAAAEGIDPATAERLAARVERLVRELHGGTHCYLRAPGKAERDRSIRALYRRGVEIALIAERHRLSISRVRQIIGAGPPC